MVKPKYKALRERAFIYCSTQPLLKLIIEELDKVSIPYDYEQHKVLQLLEIYIFQKRYLFEVQISEITARRYIRSLAYIAVQNYESEQREGLIE